MLDCLETLGRQWTGMVCLLAIPAFQINVYLKMYNVLSKKGVP